MKELTVQNQTEIKQTMQSPGWQIIVLRLAEILQINKDVTTINLKGVNDAKLVASIFLAQRAAVNLINEWLDWCLGEAIAPKLQEEMLRQAEEVSGDMLKYYIKE